MKARHVTERFESELTAAFHQPLSVASVCDRRLHRPASTGAHRDAATGFRPWEGCRSGFTAPVCVRLNPVQRFKIHFVLAYAVLFAAVFCGIAGAQTQSTPWDKYLWQTSRTTEIPASASNLVAELRAEVQKILDAGPLAPVRTVYGDLEQDPYFMYWQCGRVITTLAMAWPHLTTRQYIDVRKYVHAELLEDRRAPWSPQGFISPDSGARRELHNFSEPRGWDRYWRMWGSKKPTMGSFYGLWLYADRSGDWDLIKAHFPQIRELYSRNAAQCDLYGTMGAHIAMARIARQFTDVPTMNLAVSNAAVAFQTGTNFAAIESATQKYWKERYEPRQRGRVHQGWMFLDLCPEVGRYLSEHVQKATLERHSEGLRKYPLFWLREVPYGSRWTGDEGLGIPTELMGMIVPMERWVAGASAQTIARYVRSSPICLGDCYWLEALIHAIEVSGKTECVDARR
jgi:hypothetical protein